MTYMVQALAELIADYEVDVSRVDGLYAQFSALEEEENKHMEDLIAVQKEVHDLMIEAHSYNTQLDSLMSHALKIQICMYIFDTDCMF